MSAHAHRTSRAPWHSRFGLYTNVFVSSPVVSTVYPQRLSSSWFSSPMEPAGKRCRHDHSTTVTDEAANECSVDFRAAEDDAWYGVTLRVESLFSSSSSSTCSSSSSSSSSSEDALLRVMFGGFDEQWDARFLVSQFKRKEQLEEFKERFRKTSSQLQDHDCCKVVKGVKVCASCTFHGNNGDELKFYDAIVDSVCRGNHEFVNGEELCRCSFILRWQHGPNYGKIASTGVANICLMEDGSEGIHPALDLFLGLVMRNLGSPLQRSGGNYESTSELQPNELNSRDKSINEVAHDLDLGGNYMPTVADLKNNYYIWIENLEKDLLPDTIIGFLYIHTRILVKTLVLPTFYSLPYTRAIIIVDTREKTMKLLDLLCNPQCIIVSTSGRPWVIAEKKWSYGSLGHLSQIIENLQEEPATGPNAYADKLTLASKGTKEFEKGLLLRALFLELYEHVLRLHRRLVVEERKILQSNDLHVQW